MEFSQFLPCMFSPVEYNAAKSLGEAAKRNSRHFYFYMFSPVVYSAAKRSGETAQYMDGTLANFFVAFSGLISTLCHFVPLGHDKNGEKSVEKHQNGGLGGLGEALGGLGGPSTISYGKRNPKSGSLTPFLGPHFRHFLSHGLTFFMSAQDLG